MFTVHTHPNLKLADYPQVLAALCACPQDYVRVWVPAVAHWAPVPCSKPLPTWELGVVVLRPVKIARISDCFEKYLLAARMGGLDEENEDIIVPLCCC